jgi:hypothetical protein
MAAVRHPSERSVALLTGVALAFFEPWIGLLIGIVATYLVIGHRDAETMERIISDKELEIRNREV